jgi:hypothetical protein
MSKRRWNKSFFLNIVGCLTLGGITYLLDGWLGIGIAVGGYLCGGFVVLMAAGE